ncbi:thiopeptide-type bacteriocin biosynthesis domain-containing protein [Streptomyces sp. yr375]|uniref:lantibiotic dehydratase n=1 Tax=Streptomyces sp. yr375 TaxID=1761906 RepID=UPI0008C6C148|nr:lantibiotic dehydratase [Streptomyces sp. yr375]SES47304.1 thiopeptide-type bacteriocin biosynthesis domain-containing protein [Streptomyces sp. yr375]
MSPYEPAGFFLLRSPVLPVDTYLDIMADPARTPQALVDFVGRPDIARALLIASEDLTGGLDRLDSLSEKRTRRLHSRLLRYATRMATRPTPFGAFSGVAMGTFGPGSEARLGRPQEHRVRVRADMGWLLALIERLETDPALLRQLHLVLNPMAHLAGDRVVLPQADKYGRHDARTVRVRATPAVDLVMRTAAVPVPYERLTAELSTAFPEVSPESVERLVRQLWDLGFLTGDLRPPQTAERPELHVLKKLTGVPAATAAAEQLRAVADLADRVHDTESLRRLSVAQRDLVPEHTDRTYQADTALDLRDPVLNESIAQEVAEAVGVLVRLSAAHGTRTHLTRYREEFTERYGAGTRVPVLSLLSPDTGLDAPPTYTNPPRGIALPPAPAEDTSRLDGALVEFAQQAWWDRAVEVELTDAWLDRLAPARPGPGDPPPALEAYVQIDASDRKALDRGEWRAVLRSDSLAYGGRTFGRFGDLLGEAAGDRLRDYARREEALFPDVAYADLAFLPPYGRAANVTLRPAIRPYEIPVNTTPSVAPDRVVPLDDILVGVADDRFHLWSRRLDREIVVAQHHMLSPTLAPNVARFLIEVSQDGCIQPTGFHWGPAEAAPFLPRVTRGRVVLRPAQWRLTAGTADDLDGWRERWRVPRHVYLVEADQRLLLDLDHPACRVELREELDKQRTLVLHEMLPSFDGMWLQDTVGDRYAAEVVVPVVLRDAVRATRRSLPRGRREVPVERHLPGGEWTFLKVYAAPERQDEIIAGPLRDLVAELRRQGLLDRWFYIRYADPFPHLRLRVRGTDAARALTLVTTWGRSLVGQGLARDIELAGYAPEIARYGGPEVFDAAELMFQASSETTASLLARRLDIRPKFLAVAALDTLYTQWGGRPSLRTGHIIDQDDVQVRDTRQLFHAHRAYLCELLSPWDRAPHEEGRSHRLLLHEIFADQASSAGRMAEAVRQAERDEVLVGSEDGILASLAHMQINRLLPIDLDREARSHALWAHVLRAIRGRAAAAAREER